jgi:hypothetical protein
MEETRETKMETNPLPDPKSRFLFGIKILSGKGGLFYSVRFLSHPDKDVPIENAPDA